MRYIILNRATTYHIAYKNSSRYTLCGRFAATSICEYDEHLFHDKVVDKIPDGLPLCKTCKRIYDNDFVDAI